MFRIRLCCYVLLLAFTWPILSGRSDEPALLRHLPPLTLNDNPSDPLFVAQRDEYISVPPNSPESMAPEIAIEEFEILEEVPPSDWHYPRIFRPSKTLERGMEIGINGSQGNSETISLTAGANAKRIHGATTLKWDLNYARTESDSVETQNNALLNVDYGYDLTDSAFSMFAKLFFEYDEFKAFDTRLAANAGAGYSFIKNECVTLKGRFGAGWSREIGGPDDRNVPEATFGGNYDHQLTERQKLVMDVQYLPEWEHFSNYRLVTDANWEVLLDEATDLHLKIGLIDRYDSTPNGAEPNDLTYALLLLWKL